MITFVKYARFFENFRKCSLQVVSYLLMFSPIIDVITGARLLCGFQEGSISVSFIYKMLILFLCALNLLSTNFLRREYKIMLCYLFFAQCLFFFSLLGLSFEHLLNATVQNITMWVKLLAPFVVFWMYKENTRNCFSETKRQVKNILQCYRVFFPFSILIPTILGIGFPTYDYGVGEKGFYFAGNDVSIIMVAIAILNVERAYHKTSLWNILLAISSMVVLVNLGTKTSLLMTVMIVLVYLFFILRRQQKVLFCILFVSGVVTCLGLILFQSEIGAVIDSQKYQYLRYWKDNGGILSFLLSGRNLMAQKALSLAYQNNMGIFSFLFGIGSYQQQRLTPDFMIVEMDFIDLLLCNGFLFSVVFIGVNLLFCWKTVKNASFYLKFIYIAMVSFSAFWGHLLFTPMVNITLAIFCVAMLFERYDPKHEACFKLRFPFAFVQKARHQR